MWAVISERVLVDGVVKPAAVLIDNERIVDICTTLPADFKGRVEDQGNALIMAGIVDTHVHINEPGRTEWEGFEHATRAAAAGGITTLVDMPLNCIPVTINAAAFAEKLEAVTGSLFVDVGFWGGVTPDSLNDLPDLLKAGVLGVKSFLIDSGIDEFQPMAEADLKIAMDAVGKAGLPYLIHAELDDGLRLPVNDRYQSFLDSRPRAWENHAVELMIRLMEHHHCRVHIVHLSSSDVLPAVGKARELGLPLTIETCPHYLVLESEKVPDGKTLFKCCPPIREHTNRALLWRGIQDGLIDFIVSDHSPCTPALKELESGDLDRAWGGISSLQFTLPLVWTEARERGLDVADLSLLMSGRTADFIGLGHRKGRLAPGYDADLIAWDPDETFEIQNDQIFYRHKMTPYAGRRVFGRIHKTWLRGETVFNGTDFPAEPRGQTLLKE